MHRQNFYIVFRSLWTVQFGPASPPMVAGLMDTETRCFMKLKVGITASQKISASSRSCLMRRVKVKPIIKRLVCLAKHYEDGALLRPGKAHSEGVQRTGQRSAATSPTSSEMACEAIKDRSGACAKKKLGQLRGSRAGRCEHRTASAT